MDNLVLVEVSEPLQDLSGVEDDSRLLQRAPFRSQQSRKASWRKERRSGHNLSWNGKMTKQLARSPNYERRWSLVHHQIWVVFWSFWFVLLFLLVKCPHQSFWGRCSLSDQHTSGHLFHENLDVSVLRHGAQILNDVPVLQVLVESNLFMKGLGVPGQRETLLSLHESRHNQTQLHTSVTLNHFSQHFWELCHSSHTEE